NACMPSARKLKRGVSRDPDHPGWRRRRPRDKDTAAAALVEAAEASASREKEQHGRSAALTCSFDGGRLNGWVRLRRGYRPGAAEPGVRGSSCRARDAGAEGVGLPVIAGRVEGRPAAGGDVGLER